MTDPTDQNVSQTARGSESESAQTGANLMLGFDHYFGLVRHQMDLHRELTMTWATAMTSMSAAVLGQLHTVEHILAGQADQLAHHAHGAEQVARGMAEQVVIAEKTLGSWVDHQPAASEAVHGWIPAQRTMPQRAANPAAANPAAATRRTATAQPEPTVADHDQVRTTPDIFDELIEFIVDEDIKAAIPSSPR